VAEICHNLLASGFKGWKFAQQAPTAAQRFFAANCCFWISTLKLCVVTKKGRWQMADGRCQKGRKTLVVGVIAHA
jgi:hypothetical protein